MCLVKDPLHSVLEQDSHHALACNVLASCTYHCSIFHHVRSFYVAFNEHPNKSNQVQLVVVLLFHLIIYNWYHSLCGYPINKLRVWFIARRNQTVSVLFFVLFESFKHDIPSCIFLNFSEANVANWFSGEDSPKSKDNGALLAFCFV